MGMAEGQAYAAQGGAASGTYTNTSTGTVTHAWG